MWSPPRSRRHCVADRIPAIGLGASRLSTTFTTVSDDMTGQGGLRFRVTRHFRLALATALLGAGVAGCASFRGLETSTSPAQIGLRAAAPEFDETPRVAAAASLQGLIAAPRPFAWSPEAHSAGHRPFQTMTFGQGDFRVLVVGSVGGHDPVAVALLEQLARSLHDDSLILGGFQAKVIRTLNPDGAATRTRLNGLGEYINHGFPSGNSVNQPGSDSARIPEVRFLLEKYHELRPQRVIHIRSVSGSQGLIGYDGESRTAAAELAQWLNFRTVDLTRSAVAGSLERYFSEVADCEVIVFGVAETAEKSQLWERCGDALLNLMLQEDFSTREIARRNRKSGSADRRNLEP